MVGEERRGALLAHVARKDAWLGSPQVDHDQSVERIAELVVGVEPEQPAAELQVLLEKDGHALVVVLDSRDYARQLLDILQIGDFHLVAALRALHPERPPRLDVPRKARFAVVRPQIVDHQLTRDRRVAVADADRPEQDRVARRAQNEPPDSAPKEQQRREAALVLRANEGASKLDRGIERLQQPRTVSKEGPRVQPALSVTRENLVRETHA